MNREGGKPVLLKKGKHSSKGCAENRGCRFSRAVGEGVVRGDGLTVHCRCANTDNTESTG